MKNAKLVSQAKKALKKSTRIDGFWNYWLKQDGTLPAEYQCGQDALFILEKRGTKVFLVDGVVEGIYLSNDGYKALGTPLIVVRSALGIK